MWQKVGALIITGGAVIGVLYTGGSWMAEKVVWAGQFDQTVADFNCQFDSINRTQLEGQAADVVYRIATYTSKKILVPDEARDLAALHVRKDAIQRRLIELGSECDMKSRRAPSKK